MSNFEYDHFDITELAKVEKVVDTPDGPKRMLVLDHKLLHKLQKERAAQGRKVLKPFQYWLILNKSCSADQAKRYQSTVWIALWETNNRPWELFERDEIAISRRDLLNHSLKLFAEWILENSSEPSEKKWAHEAIQRCSEFTIARKAVGRKPKGTRVRERVDPLSKEDYDAVFKCVEKWHKSHGARYPWARPIMRLRLKLGLFAQKTVIYYLERDAAKRALESGKHGASIKLFGPNNKVFLVPTKVIKKELQTLVDYPAPWGILADLICPHGEDEETRVRLSVKWMMRIWASVASESDGVIPVGSGPKTSAWSRAMRYRAILEAFKATKNLVVVSKIFGVPLTVLQKYQFLFPEKSPPAEEEYQNGIQEIN